MPAPSKEGRERANCRFEEHSYLPLLTIRVTCDYLMARQITMITDYCLSLPDPDLDRFIGEAFSFLRLPRKVTNASTWVWVWVCTARTYADTGTYRQASRLDAPVINRLYGGVVVVIVQQKLFSCVVVVFVVCHHVCTYLAN